MLDGWGKGQDTRIATPMNEVDDFEMPTVASAWVGVASTAWRADHKRISDTDA